MNERDRRVVYQVALHCLPTALDLAARCVEDTRVSWWWSGAFAYPHGASVCDPLLRRPPAPARGPTCTHEPSRYDPT